VSVTSDLSFYRQLRSINTGTGSNPHALAFARICHDLLLRICAAWAVQRQYDEVPVDLIPRLDQLFAAGLGSHSSAFAPDDPAIMDDGLVPLLHAVTTWLLESFDPVHPLDSSYQVWVGVQGETLIHLCGPPRPQQPPVGIELNPSLGAEHAAQMSGEATCIGHYDVHGLTALAVSLRSLRRLGVDSKGILGFEQTGDIGKLWKRTVPHALKGSEDGSQVVLIDCPVHSRTPEHTLRALRQLDALPQAHLTIIDHHPDTIRLAPMLAHERVRLVLTDVPSCALLSDEDLTTRDLRVLGAISDKVPEIAAAYPEADFPLLYAANDAYHSALLHFSPTPREMKSSGVLPCEALWEALASGSTVSTDLAALVVPPVAGGVKEANHPASLNCGKVLFVTEKLSLPGRSWYSMLERLMEKSDLSYAVALRVLDNRRANMLLLTHWRHTSVPPIRNFVPKAHLHRTLGHPSAVWIDLDKSVALGFLAELTEGINCFFEESQDFTTVSETLQKNILDAPTSKSDVSDADKEA
jgi:hypothetical protein